MYKSTYKTIATNIRNKYDKGISDAYCTKNNINLKQHIKLNDTKQNKLINKQHIINTNNISDYPIKNTELN